MSLTHQDDWLQWSNAVADMLASNKVEVSSHRYTRPAPSTYEHQWLWDSCFHAIIYRWLDPIMARDELLSIVEHQIETGPDAGMIPHMVYWHGGGEDLWHESNRSVITQPPLVGVAATLVYEVTGDFELISELYPRLCAYHEWLDRRRDPDSDNLVSIIHPWESGWDASPRWDRAMRLNSPTDDEARTARMTLVARLIEYGCDAIELARVGFFHVEAVDFNAIRSADLEALGMIAGELGKPTEAAHWQTRAESVQLAIRTKMSREWPHDLEGLDEIPIMEENAAAYVALFGGCVASEEAKRLVDRLRLAHNWPAFPVPTTPTTATSFAPARYWRGNTWLNVNWLIYMGLRRYGYFDLASELAARSLRLEAVS